MSSILGRPPCAALLGVAGLALASLGSAGPARAEPAPAYAALLAQARGEAPRLAASRADVDQAVGLSRQAAVRPNPVIGLEIENLAAAGSLDGLGGRQTTLSVQQTLEMGGKRSARIAAGRSGVAAAEARDALVRADFAARLAVAYAEAEAAAARLVQAQEALSAADLEARAARELVDAGREAELRALQAGAEREAARADRDEAVAARTSAFARLSALAGSPVVFDGVSESLLLAPADAAAQEEAQAASPAVVAARAERTAAAARVDMESRRAVPDLTVSAGVRRLTGDDATAVVAGISLPLPIFGRNRGAAQSARADLPGAEARLRQATLDAEADLRIARAQAAGAAARVQAAASSETAAAEAYRLARLGYEAGRLPLLELSTARRALSAARLRLIEARLAHVRAQAEIARLTGRTPFGA